MERNDSSRKKCEKISLSDPSIGLLFTSIDLEWAEVVVATRYSLLKRRPRVEAKPQILAHLFKALRQIKSFRKLEEELSENDGLWAHVLGFEKPPKHQSFSDFRRRVGSVLFIEILRELRTRLVELKPDLAEVVVVDSTNIPAYAKPARGRRKSSDKDAKWGIRINPKTGKKEYFFGHKLHLALSAKYGAPLEFRVTPGKNGDSPEFPKLIQSLSEANVSFGVAVADAGYDARTNYYAAIRHKAKPVIAFNRRGKPAGTTGRLLDREMPVRRHSKDWKQFYAMRGAIEREFAELKEQLGMRFLTLRGLERVTIHLSLSLIVLLAINLVAHLTGNPELLRSIEPWRYSDV